MTSGRLSRRSILALAAVLPWSGMASGYAAARVSSMRYTMTAFTNRSQTDMWVFESTDATNFSLVAPAAYRPPQAGPAATPRPRSPTRRVCAATPTSFGTPTAPTT